VSIKTDHAWINKLLNYFQALKYENFADVGSSAEESENEDGDSRSIYNNNDDGNNIERMIENSMTESHSNFGGETSSTDNNLEDSKTGKIIHLCSYHQNESKLDNGSYISCINATETFIGLFSIKVHVHF